MNNAFNGLNFFYRFNYSYTHSTQLTSHTWHHKLDITHSTSHTCNHTLGITHSASHTWHHTLGITHLTSHTWHHTLDITHRTSHTGYHTLDITHWTSHTGYQRWAHIPVELCVPACPRSLIFPLWSAFPHSCWDIFFAFPCALAFLFHVPMLLCHRVYVWGVGVWLITRGRALCVYGRIRWAGSTCHLTITPPRHAWVVYEYIWANTLT